MRLDHRTAPLIAMTVLCASLAAGAALATSASFPGGAPLPDPSGRWTVEWREATSTAPHALLLRDGRTGKVRPLLEFDRSVDVAWSPDGGALAVTNHEASNESVVSAYWPARPGVVLRVDELFVASLSPADPLLRNGHRYFKAVQWLGPKLLRLSLSAYDADPGRQYQRLFDVDIDTRTVREAHD